MSQECFFNSKGQQHLRHINRSSGWREVIIPLHLALIRPHLDLHYRKILIHWSEHSEGLLRSLWDAALALCGKANRTGLVQSGEDMAPGDFAAAWQGLWWSYWEDKVELFTVVCTVVCGRRLRGNGHKMRDFRELFRPDIIHTKNRLIMKTAEQWNRMPREIVLSTSWKFSIPS